MPPVSQDQALCGRNCVAAILSQIGMTPVMKQDNVPASMVALDSLASMLKDAVCCCVPMPIVASDAPHHRLEAELARNLEHGGTARSERRTKMSRLHARGIGDCLGAV